MLVPSIKIKVVEALHPGFAGGVIPLERVGKEEIAVIEAAKAGRQDSVYLAAAIKQTVPTGQNMHTL